MERQENEEHQKRREKAENEMQRRQAEAVECERQRLERQRLESLSKECGNSFLYQPHAAHQVLIEVTLSTCLDSILNSAVSTCFTSIILNTIFLSMSVCAIGRQDRLQEAENKRGRREMFRRGGGPRGSQTPPDSPPDSPRGSYNY